MNVWFGDYWLESRVTYFMLLQSYTFRFLSPQRLFLWQSNQLNVFDVKTRKDHPCMRSLTHVNALRTLLAWHLLSIFALAKQKDRCSLWRADIHTDNQRRIPMPFCSSTSRVFYEVFEILCAVCGSEGQCSIRKKNTFNDTLFWYYFVLKIQPLYCTLPALVQVLIWIKL